MFPMNTDQREIRRKLRILTQINAKTRDPASN